MPMFDTQSIYTAIKKVEHTCGIDVVIIDYFKSGDAENAFETYAQLGNFVNFVKNRVAGDMGIAAIGAAQATASGKVADSSRIGRNASSIIMITDKSEDELDADGPECGNKKLRVVLNRNGPQHAAGEYIDIKFDGNVILYEEAKQHVEIEPF